MIKLLGKIPHKINLAFSGGVDSLAAAHFLKRGRRDVTLLHFNHGCQYSNKIEEECRERAEVLALPIIVGHIPDSEPFTGGSKENYWRKHRYRFLMEDETPTITCHHLDDAVETWVWSSMHGNPKIIPYSRGNIIRPFLLTKKKELEAYCERYGLIPVDDPYNRDTDLTRNYIRANMMEHVRVVNPGIDTVIIKKYERMKNEVRTA